MNIRSRFALALLTVLVIALFLVVTFSTILVSDAFRKTLDDNIRSTARMVAAAVDNGENNVVPDSEDRKLIARLRTESHITVIDHEGRIVDGYHPPPQPQNLKHGTAFDSRFRNNDVRVVVQPVERDGRTIGTVVVWRPNRFIQSAVRDTLGVSILVSLAVLALGAAVARRVADSVVSPVNEMADLIERIEERDLSLRVGGGGNDELGRLAASFDRMLDRLQGAFSREREFAADASHELRAPLAVLRAEVELALRRQRTEKEYREAFERALREVERLEALIDDLLAAARAEAGAVRPEIIDLRALADDVVKRTSKAASVKNVTLRAEGDAETVLADPVAIERALLAIVHNAIAHTPERGSVTLGVSRSDGSTSIAIRDTGAGFSDAALEHASKRFWRGDDSRPRGGTGLGLSIADAFVRANGGTLRWSNDPSGGAVVTLEFRTFA